MQCIRLVVGDLLYMVYTPRVRHGSKNWGARTNGRQSCNEVNSRVGPTKWAENAEITKTEMQEQ